MTSEDESTASKRALKAEDAQFLESLIGRFLKAQVKHDGRGRPTAEIQVGVVADEIFRVCQLAVESFKQQSALLRIQKHQLPITICGDIHGQFREIRLIVDTFGTMDKHNYLFMGDYGDRGVQGIETIMFLMTNKVLYPNKCFLLRGNHEDYNTSMVYGLLDECLNKYGNFVGQRLWLAIINVFNHMPFAALIADKVFTVHGGISPHIRTLNDINKIPRPTIIPLYGLACDLVWSDPKNEHEGWALSPRGISFTFDDKTAERFCQLHGVDLIVRGHQISNDMHRTGYIFSPTQRILTLFTASDYLRSQNTGAVLTVDPNLTLSFTLFRPMTKKRYRKTRRDAAKQQHLTISKEEVDVNVADSA